MSRKPKTPDLDQRGQHGARHMPGLAIDSYNLALADPEGEGFLGDRASQTAFRDLLQLARERQLTGKDPFGKEPTVEISKRRLDLVLVGGDPDAAHLLHLVVEDHARRLAHVITGFLAQPEWDGVQRIVLGGGFPDSQVGGLACRRAKRLLELGGSRVRIDTLRAHADEGAMLGWVHLAPEAVLRSHDAFLAVDVGGTNLRCGIVEHRTGKDADGSSARVIERLQWRHASDEPDRGEAIDRLAGMLNGLAAQARTIGLSLAPFVGIACPGEIQDDGGIPNGAQNLPGDWEIPFNLPQALSQRLDDIDGEPPVLVMHNDAVMQGLGERHRMRKARRWAVMTIGTGLGNAVYTNA